eukprot:c12191_g1_i1.p1 GENE.c12191_g1_i1~~c12191_g1_i1.p1  ORF type:complete len:252 (+),score=41.84 c12191_g1_i1:274-1029(+)
MTLNITSIECHVAHLTKLLALVAWRNEEFVRTSPQPLPAKTLFHENMDTHWHELLQQLIHQLDKNIRCSEICYSMALIYIDRLTAMSTDRLTLNFCTARRLFTTSLLIANQFIDDTPELCLQFANAAGIPSPTLARLKTEFLFRVKFSLAVTSDEVMGYAARLQGRLSAQSLSDISNWPRSQNNENETSSARSPMHIVNSIPSTPAHSTRTSSCCSEWSKHHHKTSSESLLNQFLEISTEFICTQSSDSFQ